MTILGFTHRMSELMAASDVLIQNAGGLTWLEAFGAGLPVVMFEPLPGHGEDNSRRMCRAGLVTVAADAADLRAMVDSTRFWETLAPAQASRARALLDHESAAAATTRLTMTAVTQPGHARRLAPMVAISCALGAWFMAENPPTGYDATPRQLRTPPSRTARPARSAVVPPAVGVASRTVRSRDGGKRISIDSGRPSRPAGHTSSGTPSLTT